MIEDLPHILTIAVASVAAGLGAVCRLLLDGLVTTLVARRSTPRLTAKPDRGLPWGTLAVNLSGSLIIGIVAGILSVDLVGGPNAPTYLSLIATSWSFVAILGFVSGYTTFSTASYQTVRLAQSGRWGSAAAVGLGQLLAAAALVALGWAAVWLIAGFF